MRKVECGRLNAECGMGNGGGSISDFGFRISDLSQVALLVGVALIAGGLAARSAHAQSRALQDHMAACAVEVRNVLADGSGAHTGSGVLVNVVVARYVVTNHHVACAAAGRLELRLADGRTVGATVVAADPVMDLAVLAPAAAVRGGATLGCLDLRARYWIAGFGGAPYGRLHFHATRLTCVAGLGTGRWSWCRCAGPVCSGDSGAGVFNAAGEVVGVMWGTTPTYSIGTLGRPFEELLTRVAYGGARREALGAHGPQPTAHSSQPVPCQYCEGPACARPVQIGVAPRVIYYTPPATPQPAQPANPPASSLQPPASPPCDCDARLAAIDARLAALEGREPPDLAPYVHESELPALVPPPPDLSGVATKAELERQAAAAAQTERSLVDKVKDLAGKVKAAGAVVAAAGGEAAAGGGGLLAGWGYGAQLAAILGIGGAPALAVAAAGTIAYRRLKRRIARRTSPTASSGGSSTGTFR